MSQTAKSVHSISRSASGSAYCFRVSPTISKAVSVPAPTQRYCQPSLNTVFRNSRTPVSVAWWAAAL